MQRGVLTWALSLAARLCFLLLGGASGFQNFGGWRHTAHYPTEIIALPVVMVDEPSAAPDSNEVDDEAMDVAFAAMFERERSQEIIQREVNKLSLPDVPLWLIFENVAQPVVLPGKATTDVLHAEAARLHNLDPNQRIRFFLNGAMLPLGVDISATPLAKTRNLHVEVRVLDWPVKRGVANPAESVSGTAVSAIRARRDPIPMARSLLRCDSGVDAVAAQAEYDRQTPIVVQCPECGGQWQEKLRDVLTELSCVDCGAKFYAQHPDTVPPPDPIKKKKKRTPTWMEIPPLSSESGCMAPDGTGSTSSSSRREPGGRGKRRGTNFGNSVAPW